MKDLRFCNDCHRATYHFFNENGEKWSCGICLITLQEYYLEWTLFSVQEKLDILREVSAFNITQQNQSIQDIIHTIIKTQNYLISRIESLENRHRSLGS